MGGIDGKVVVVTGAASGIGLASLARLTAEGAMVVGAGADITPAEGVEPLDVTDEGAVGALIASVVDRHGRIDGLVHAAKVAGGGPAHAVEAAEWHWVVGVTSPAPSW